MDRFEDADKRYNSGLFDFRKDTVTPSLKIDDKLLSDILSELYPPQYVVSYIVENTTRKRPEGTTRDGSTSSMRRETLNDTSSTEASPTERPG